MKLVKLSLAAIIAAGAMTSFASATPLEEAIRGLEVSGLARYRFDSESDAKFDDNGSQNNRFTGELNVVAPVTDNLKFGITLAMDFDNYASNDASSAGSIDVDKFWFQYAVDGLTVKAGKIEIPTPWTEAGVTGSRGNGILALYSGLPNWTFAGAYYNQVNGLNDSNIPAGSLSSGDFASFDDINAGQEDLMALAAIGNIGPVGVQLWAARMEHIIDYTIFGELSYGYEGFNIRGQVNYLALGDGWVAGTPGGATYDKLYNDDAGFFYGLEAGYENDNFFINLGYTATDEDMPLYVLDGDNDGFIKFGQQLYLFSQNNPDTQVYFGNAGIKYNKFGFEVGYGFADVGYASNQDMDEFYGLITYDVAKNLAIGAYYSVLNSDNKDNENNEFELEILYKF